MQSALRLIVGLGNPGAEYSETRHNAGFWFCERLARDIKVGLAKESRYHGWTANARNAGADGVWLLMPATYMNDSGRSVRALMQFYRIEPAEMLVVHDELDLPPGQMRLKFGGGLGGHNGLKSISAHLGTNDYWRLRIGIGHPRDGALSEQEVADYVLHPPPADERPLIEDAIARALAIWPWLARGETERAMHELHTVPRSPPAAEEPAGS